MVTHSSRITNGDCIYVLEKLSKWIDDMLEFRKDSDGKYMVESTVKNDDNLNLRFLGLKKGIANNRYGFSLFYENCRIKGIDWETRQILEDGTMIEDCYHCNEWNESTQRSSAHRFDVEIDRQLSKLDDEHVVRYVLKRWNIRYTPLEQLKLGLNNG
jgi:hypothetical protein